MKTKKHIETISEVLDEITSAIKDSRGMIFHQRRLALMLSVGVASLIEIYFHKLGVMKEGSAVKHEWLKTKNAENFLQQQIVCPLNVIEHIDEIISLSKEIEEKRNELAYGSPVNKDTILKEKIEVFLKIKKIIEEKVGDIS